MNTYKNRANKRKKKFSPSELLENQFKIKYGREKYLAEMIFFRDGFPEWYNLCLKAIQKAENKI